MVEFSGTYQGYQGMCLCCGHTAHEGPCLTRHGYGVAGDQDRPQQPCLTLHMMIGLPRSGKTTAARELGHPIVSPDSIRLALHGHVWREEAEPMVWAIARIMVESLFGAGHTQVTLDACNHNEKRRMPWQTGRWGVVFHLVTTDVETCLQRAREGGRQDLLPVIERMARDWEPLGGKTDC